MTLSQSISLSHHIITPHQRVQTALYKMFKHAFNFKERWWECIDDQVQKSMNGSVIWNLRLYCEEINRLNRLFPNLALQPQLGINSDQLARHITDIVLKSDSRVYYYDLYQNMYCNFIHAMVGTALRDAFPTIGSKKLTLFSDNSVRHQNFLLLRHTLLSTIPNGYVILRPKSVFLHETNRKEMTTFSEEHFDHEKGVIKKSLIQNLSFVKKLNAQPQIKRKSRRLYINRSQQILTLVSKQGLDSFICVGKGGLCVVLTGDGHLKTAYRKRFSRDMILQKRFEQDRIRSVLYQTEGILS